MTGIFLGEPTAEIFIKPGRIIAYNIFWLFASFLGALLIMKFYAKGGEFELYLVAVFLVYVTMCYETWGALWRTPHIRVNETGLDIKGLGFWKKDEYQLIGTRNQIKIILPDQGRDLPRDRFAIGAASLKHDRVAKNITLHFKFPDFTSNVTVKDFCALMLLPGLVRKLKDVQKARMKKYGLQLLLTGKMHPGLMSYFINITLCVLVGFVFYALFVPRFFPSDAWGDSGFVLCVVLAICFAAILWLNARHEKKKNPAAYHARMASLGKQKMGQGYVLAISPFLLWGFFYLAIILGMANLYTGLAGTPHKATYVMEKKTYSSRRGYCFESDALGTTIFARLCVHQNDYYAAGDQAEMEVFGKQTWFGFLVDRYKLATSSQIQEAR